MMLYDHIVYFLHPSIHVPMVNSAALIHPAKSPFLHLPSGYD